MEKQTTKNNIVPEKLNHLYSYANSNPINYMDILGLDWVSDGNGGYQPSSQWNGRLPGDYFSDPSGNLWGPIEKQDLLCSLGPVSPIANACPVILRKCIRHDDCYTFNQCNATSWIPILLGATKPCNKCNLGFFKQ